MKRWLIRTAFLLLGFAAGFGFAYRSLYFRAIEEAEEFKESCTKFQARIYGTDYLHLKNIDKEREERLAAYDPARDGGTISFGYCSFWTPNGQTLELHGDGRLESRIGEKSRLVAQIAPERCKAIFQDFLTSGILNYSEAVIDLKKDLPNVHGPGSIMFVDDGCYNTLRLHAPTMEVEKEIKIYEPKVELRNYPDIIEFQIYLRLEKELTDLVPEGDPDWSTQE